MGTRRRLRVLRRDNYRCVYCRVELAVNKKGVQGSTTVDHIVPRVHGGRDADFNMVACCQACNTAKADKPYIAFADIEAIQYIGKVKRGEV